MELNNLLKVQDGDLTTRAAEAPSPVNLVKQKSLDENVKKKRRRGKSKPKRKIMKPFSKIPWRRNDKSKRDNRFRSLVLSKTHAPFNNNQFLMEIHKPEPENNFQIIQTPSARTRDSSFSVDSEENYFYSLPEDEEDFLTKEFSSVYEDAQSERLSNMSKNELIQEYLLLEAKYENLVKRTDRSRAKLIDEDKDNTVSERDTSATDRDSMATDKDTSETSLEQSMGDEPTVQEYIGHIKAQEDQIRELKLVNEKLRVENEHLRHKSHCSSSEDSESDSSSTTLSSSSSSSRVSPMDEFVDETNDVVISNSDAHNGINGENGVVAGEPSPCVNGFPENNSENIENHNGG